MDERKLIAVTLFLYGLLLGVCFETQIAQSHAHHRKIVTETFTWLLECSPPKSAVEAGLCLSQKNQVGLLLTAFSGGIAVFGLLVANQSLIISRKNREITQQQEARSRRIYDQEMRPWLSVTTEIMTHFKRVTTQFQDQFKGRFRVKLQNSGKLPASEVRLDMSYRLYTQGGNPYEFAENFCNNKRGPGSIVGGTVFPNSAGEIEHDIWVPVNKVEELGGDIFVFVFGCVTYKDPEADKYRQTRFVYRVKPKPGDDGLLHYTWGETDWQIQIDTVKGD